MKRFLTETKGFFKGLFCFGFILSLVMNVLMGFLTYGILKEKDESLFDLDDGEDYMNKVGRSAAIGFNAANNATEPEDKHIGFVR